MFAILAVVAFALALVFRLVGHGTGFLWVDMALTGLLCLSLHQVVAIPLPPAWRRGPQ